MHSVAPQALAGGTPLPPRTFDLNVQLGPQDGSQQTDEGGPPAVDVSFIQTMPYAGPASSSPLPVFPSSLAAGE